jgi:exodeoxyribonuclease VII small subunit
MDELAQNPPEKRAPRPKKADKTEKFVFEKAMQRLEAIVTALERGDAPLDASLVLFQEGTALIRQCGAALDNAEQQLRVLVDGPDGPLDAPFEPENP